MTSMTIRFQFRAWEIETHVSVPPDLSDKRRREHEFQFTLTYQKISAYFGQDFNLPFETFQFTTKHDLNLPSRISIYHEIQLSVPNFNLP